MKQSAKGKRPSHSEDTDDGDGGESCSEGSEEEMRRLEKLPPDEKKRAIRRMKNRQSARKVRARRIQEVVELNGKIKVMRDENHMLHTQLAQMQGHIQALSQRMHDAALKYDAILEENAQLKTEMQLLRVTNAAGGGLARVPSNAAVSLPGPHSAGMQLPPQPPHQQQQQGGMAMPMSGPSGMKRESTTHSSASPHAPGGGSAGMAPHLGPGPRSPSDDGTAMGPPALGSLPTTATAAPGGSAAGGEMLQVYGRSLSAGHSQAVRPQQQPAVHRALSSHHYTGHVTPLGTLHEGPELLLPLASRGCRRARCRPRGSPCTCSSRGRVARRRPSRCCRPASSISTADRPRKASWSATAAAPTPASWTAWISACTAGAGCSCSSSRPSPPRT